MPACNERRPPSKPSQSVELPLAAWKARKCVRSLMLVPMERCSPLSSDNCFVLTRMKPPVKSAGYSGVGLFTMVMWSNCELGRMSNEKARESASELGTPPPFIHTLLYRCERPRTRTNFSSTTDTPGTRRMTSEASLSCVRAICWADTPVCTTRLSRCCCNWATSLFRRAVAVTCTSPSVCVSASRAKSRVVSPWAGMPTSATLASRYPTYWTRRV